MLTTIRAKFAAVLLLGFSAAGLAMFGLAKTLAVTDQASQQVHPVVLIGAVMIFLIMLMVEHVVVAPIVKLTREIVAIRKSGSANARLPVNGSDELAFLATTFNHLMETLADKQRLEERLRYLAHHDALTDLPNRVSLREQLGHKLGEDQALAVLCLDLDQFKSVNDSLGHAVGDGLLRAAADRMRDCLGEGDVVARIGGDEFAIIQVSASAPSDVTLLAEQLINCLSEPFEVGGHRLVIGASVGIALAPLDSRDVDHLLTCADMALYRAKTDGRGLCRFFETGMDARMRARRKLELDLRRALPNNELELYYQPLINLEENEVSGFEALIRWNHPTRGLVHPQEFITVAEEIGLIIPIGEWVIQTACMEAANWPENIKVAVNLSPAQFRSRNLAKAVESALEASSLAPTRLELEITESVLLIENDSTLATLHQLRSLGVRISMDDFGTGYSSLSYLRSFPFDKIKIDRSFVHDLFNTGEAMAIVRAVSGLGRNLGMATTAEGVETVQQLGQLRSEGCSEVQGFLFSAPTQALNIMPVIERVRTQLQDDLNRTDTAEANLESGSRAPSRSLRSAA